MYYYRKIKTMMLLLLVCVVAKAQLEDGKVYYFENVANEGKSMTSRAPGNYLTIATTNSGDYSQLWYADEVGTDVYTLRNLGNGRYLRSPNANGNANWTCVKEVEANAKFTCSKIDGHDVLRASNSTDSYHYLHYGGGTSTIVCWTASDAKASQWTFTEVAVDGETLSDNWATLASIDPDAEELATLQNTLDALFTDKSCTVLQSTYETMTEVAIMESEHYKSLPKTLQDMVLKVYNGNWAEGNYDNDKEDWDAAYAKKYRVQLYEPYNEPGAAASALGLNAHTNMNNPTGIFANTREPLYVMVEGKIKDGADLYITSLTGHNRLGNYNDGIALHEGLNVIPSFVDGNNYYINYVVHTFDTSKGSGHEAKARKLSDYDDLKIHIEGGYINGYWNRVGDALYGEGDTNSDWEYIEARATQTDVIVLGKYMTLQFPLRDEDTEGNMGMASYLNDKVDVEDVINSWDNVMLWERLLLGVLDEATVKAEAKQSPYSITDSKQVFEYTGNETDFPAGYGDYYNVHGLAFGVGGTAYMYGSSDHSGYHYNTMSGIIRNMPTNAGSHWGPAHEIGHQHQNLINMRGETEVSNNLFSNVVLWYYGETTSRVNGTDGALENVLKNFNAEGNYLTNSIWGMTHMYYKLFLYYHVLGHNPKFYPRLFEMLRQDPIDGRGGSVDGAKAQLHLYKKACLAAEEDLTEFFRAYGFFKPLDAFLMGDYGESIFYMTQAQIDAAIAEVKALSEQNEWDRNISVLFINDATGETIKSHKGDNLELYGETRVCAEVGSYATFTEDAASADYTCEISGNTITMSGTGGVGFAIFNEKGELIGFSDKKTFEISSECALAIMGGTAEIKAMNSDNTVEEIEYDEASVKAALLGGLLEEVSALLLMSDSVNKKPGFYKTSALEALQTAHDNATEVYGSKVSASYSTAYEALYREYVAALALTTGKVPFLSGSTYVLTNKKYPALSMAVNADNKLIGTTTNLTAAAQQWTFESTGTADTYYLKNVSSNKYLGNLAKSTQAVATAATTADASLYKLFDLGDGLWALQCQNEEDELMSLHCDEGYKTVGWHHNANDNNGSWWYLTATDVVETDLPRYELGNLILKTEVLMAEVGEVTIDKVESLALAESNYYCNAPYSGSGGDKFTSYSVLCDGKTSTYLHTDYNNDTAPSDDHYIRIDLGSGNGLQYFNLNYTTRGSGNVCAPTKVAIEASNDTTTWVTLRDITSGLPTTNNTPYTIEKLGYGTSYRYVRMRVYGTSGGQQANGHYYFILSELGLSTITYAETLSSAYTSMTAGVLLDAFEANLSAQDVLATATTPAEYENAYTALKSRYEALLTAKENVDNAVLNVKKSELQTLITNTTNLITSCGEVTYNPATEDAILALQANSPNKNWYVSTNADQNTGGGNSDGDGIAALVDNNFTTYFHTRWGGAVVNEPHYIQVDMGEGMTIRDFVFSYTPRSGSPAPTSMTVYGSNDGSAFTNVLATITSGMPAHDSGSTYVSDAIASKTAYRYLRFEVTGSAGPGAVQYGGYYFFGMMEFDLTSIGGSESYTVELGINSGAVTESLMKAAYAESMSAQTTYNIATSLTQVENAIAKLQARYEALNEAKNTERLPVILTTDITAPVLYTISSKRGDTKVLQYEPASSHMFSVVDASASSAKQAFFFMEGDKATQVYVYPYAAGEQVLAANDVSDGAAKVSAKAKGAAIHEQWIFVKRIVDGATWYNLQPIGTSTYFSNHGGVGSKMGFYSAYADSDAGSLFQFQPTEVEGSGAYNSLRIYYDEATKGGNLVGGTAVGYYRVDKVPAYNTAYASSTTLLAGTSDYDGYLAAYQALLRANENLQINMPEVGKYYTIVSAYHTNHLMYATTENMVQYSREKTAQSPEALWTFTDEGYLKNLQTGCSVNNAATNGISYALGEDQHKVVSIQSVSSDGKVLLVPEGGQPMHANGKVMGWGAYGENSASTWCIVEVEDMSLVNFSLTIGQYRHAGLYLDYATIIPEGVQVYMAHTPEGDGTILAEALDGTILPAKTAVIVKGDAKTYSFKYTDTGFDGTSDLSSNLLGGSAYLKYQQVAAAGNRCCVFGHLDGEVGLYKNYVEYVDASGLQPDGLDDTDDGTHFAVLANKIYFEYQPAAVANASAFRFRFGGTTIIEEQLLIEDAIIYNLHGQRLIKVVTPGIYIINGKKTFVSEKMIKNK